MKICSIVGARPQFVKYFAVSRAIQSRNQESNLLIQEELIHTGQHYNDNMSKFFFDELGIQSPEYHLGVGSGSHGAQTAEIIRRTEAILMESQPDLVMVFGDTNSTLGGALAAAKLYIPIVHVEAGLRSFNRRMPEELNRILTDRMSHLLLCPSLPAIQNLADEGFDNALNGGKLIPELRKESHASQAFPLVANVGDVMYDVFLIASELSRQKSKVLSELNLTDHAFGLMTLHRAENTDDPDVFRHILSFLGETLDDRPVIFPVHPRTKALIERYRETLPQGIRTIPALSYFDLLQLLHHADFVLTDSGGLQKETFWAKKPCVTLREETEWVETVQSGWNQLYKNYQGLQVPDSHPQFYGDGHAAERIVRLCEEMFQSLKKRNVQ